MTSRVFFDTNVLVYADDANAGVKTGRARALLAQALRHRTGVVSTQVLIEYHAVACRKLGIAPAIALQRVRDFAVLEVVRTDVDLVLRALELHQRHGLAHWDALIVQAALAAGCKTLWSEDMQHGRLYDGLRVENPFLVP